MSNTNIPGESSPSSTPIVNKIPPKPGVSRDIPLGGVPDADDDIPEAQREGSEPVSAPSNWPKMALISAGAGAMLALLAGMVVSMNTRPTQSSIPQTTTDATTPKTSATASPSPEGNQLLGHYAYPEAPAAELVPIVPDGSIQLRKAAANQYNAMAAAAAADGVILVPISGFRSLNDQQHLFFDIKAERGQNPTKRAEVSAPPGYSEHHTGYAVDIGDGNAPSANVNPAFEQTAAFQWLQKNAAYYSFEISFPLNNAQGVSYEPWHWRFVGDIKSLETFYRARSTQGKSSNRP